MVEVNNRVQEHTVECPTSSTLCKPESKQTCQRVSGSGKVLVVNNSDVDQQSGKTEQDLRVPVLNMRGEPLMPTTPGKASRLLKQGKEKVVSCNPFFIKQVRRNNRCLQLNRKGFKPSIRKQRYILQPKDVVKYNNKAFLVKGVFNKGKWVRLMGVFSEDINCNIENVRLITYGKEIF